MGRGRELIDLYQDLPSQALLAAAIALDRYPEGIQYGPALRDVAKELHPDMTYGAMLTDVRDFLRLRFRAERSDSEVGTASALTEELSAGHLPVAVAKDPEMAILCAVSGLDSFSREGSFLFLENATRTLRDMLIGAAVDLAPEEYRSIYQDMAERFQSERPRTVTGKS